MTDQKYESKERTCKMDILVGPCKIQTFIYTSRALHSEVRNAYFLRFRFACKKKDV